MNAKELRVGDWVRHIDGECMQVTNINREHFACSRPHLWDYNNRFEPIKISDYILRRSGCEEPVLVGFERWFIGFESKKPDSVRHIGYVLENRFDYWALFRENGTWICNLKYVHQLQNLVQDLNIDFHVKL